MLTCHGPLGNHFNQNNYEAMFSLLSICSLPCPRCRTIGLILYGFYYRNVWFLNTSIPMKDHMRLHVHRLHCKNCGYTFGILPDFLVRRCRYRINDVLQIVLAAKNDIEDLLIKNESLSERIIQTVKKKYEYWKDLHRINDIQSLHFSQLINLGFCLSLYQHTNERLFLSPVPE